MNDLKSPKTKIETITEAAHRIACEQGQDFYVDPETGYQVMTALSLKKRRFCCESGCRHCPYGYPSKIKKR